MACSIKYVIDYFFHTITVYRTDENGNEYVFRFECFSYELERRIITSWTLHEANGPKQFVIMNEYHRRWLKY